MVKNLLRYVGMMMCFAISIVCIGCRSSKDIESILSSEYEGETSSSREENQVTGRVYNAIVYQMEGLTASNGLIHSASWEDFNFEIICTDPTCKHEPYEAITNPNITCSAATKQDSLAFSTESILYGGKRLLFVKSRETTEYNEYGGNAKQCFRTEVYECDLDGKNRKKLTSFDGSLVGNNSGIIYNNKIYFNSCTDITYEVVDTYIGENGIPVYESIQYETYEFCSLDLETIEFTSYAKQEKATCYFKDFIVTNNYLYFIIIDQDEATILYRLDLKTNICEEIYKDSNYFSPKGAMGSKLLIAYNSDVNINKCNIYLYDDETKTTKQILKDISSQTCCVLENQFVIQTETIDETQKDDTKNYVVAYSFFDESGNFIKTVHYNENIQMLFLLGEHLLYLIQPNEESTKKVGVYEILLDEIEEIENNGRYIINYFFR